MAPLVAVTGSFLETTLYDSVGLLSIMLCYLSIYFRPRIVLQIYTMILETFKTFNLIEIGKFLKALLLGSVTLYVAWIIGRFELI